jgi:hypothetical protein
LLFTACNDTNYSEVNQELSRQLVGKWSNNQLKLEMKSYKNSDSVSIFETNETDWESKMKMRPIMTTFKRNGTYTTVHKNLNDSLIYSLAGKWMILGDSLHMMDTFPEINPVYKYKLKFNANTLEYFGMEDCDGDGKSDDLYYSKQVKL